MKNNRNVRKLFYTIFLAFLLCFGVGYASLNSSLFIDGVAIVNPSVLKVEFQNVDVSSSGDYAMEPLIEDNNVSGNLAFSRTGEFYEFTFDAVNTGTIDAMIGSFNITPTVSGALANYIKYEVSYDNGEAISLKQAVNDGSFVRIKVRIEYIGSNTDSDFYMSFSLNINYVENDGTGLVVKDNGIAKVVIKPYANASLEEVGTVVTMGTEQFYVIGTEGDNVKLLSMYNLYVENIRDEDDNVTPIENPTGKQSELAIGYHEDYFEDELFPNVGTVDFSSDSQRGEYYNDYNGSIVEQYVNDYSNILKSYGVEVLEARLITDAELSSSKIGCESDMLSCEDAPGFIHSTSYWTMTDVGLREVRAVFYGGLYGYTEYCDSYIGVRPVIVIPKSTVVMETSPLTNGSINKIGTRVIIGGEQFYVIGTEGENVKLLSMWNITLDSNPKQSSLAAKTYFSSTDSTYIGSYAETYVLNYKNKLVNNGLTVKDARLITYDEMIDVDTFDCDYYCNENYRWIYSIDFWTQTPEDTLFVWEMSEEGLGGSNIRYVKSGIRPVIVIPKNIIKMI